MLHLTPKQMHANLHVHSNLQADHHRGDVPGLHIRGRVCGVGAHLAVEKTAAAPRRAARQGAHRADQRGQAGKHVKAHAS